MDTNIIPVNKCNIEEKAFQAAYALNMCTISVSQVIDYDDINVLEQEYEAILNNLNLEKMPKDEALLNILKQLLDTITYFRMSEGDKALIEREYEHKLKNALWSAVPNIGLIVAGGNPWTMAISLASQVGIGYMNYRRNKADYALEKEKEYWKLERTAMEQFNSLKRELFTTAWRLADTYGFPDNYRLTERQITRYNKILEDQDAIRRFERLSYIREGFYAYPPFWYYLGHAANEIYQMDRLSQETRLMYKELAVKCFDFYFECNKNSVLREDQTVSSCALEYIELLDFQEDRDKILGLLNEARKFSPDSEDVLQICAFNYLKLQDYESAEETFRFLVNENYNTVFNAQMLSMIYVKDYISNENSSSKSLYEILCSRINPNFLYPFPDSPKANLEVLNRRFLEIQKENVQKSCFNVLKNIFIQYSVTFNRQFPFSYKYEDYSDTFYRDSQDAKKFRIEEAEEAFRKNADLMRSRLLEADVIENYFAVLNKMCKAIYSFGFITDRNVLKAALETDAHSKSEVFKAYIENSGNRMNIQSYTTFANMTFATLTGRFMNKVLDQMFRYVDSLVKMEDIIALEADLGRACSEYRINDIYIDVKSETTTALQQTFMETIRPARIIGDAYKEIQKKNELVDNMIECIKKHEIGIVTKANCGKIRFLYRGDESFSYYMRSVKRNDKYTDDGIAIIDVDDGSPSMIDILLTTEGVYPIKNKSMKEFQKYENVKLTKDGYIQFYADSFIPIFTGLTDKYNKCKEWDNEKIHRLFMQLSDFTKSSTIGSSGSINGVEEICDAAWRKYQNEKPAINHLFLGQDNTSTRSIIDTRRISYGGQTGTIVWTANAFLNEIYFWGDRTQRKIVLYTDAMLRISDDEKARQAKKEFMKERF